MSAERAIQKVDPQQAGEVLSVKDVILRSANNPNMDPDRLERFLVMYERLAAVDAERAYDEAMTAAQREMRPVAADSNNPSTKSRYASYAALDNALRPIYTAHGFSLSFRAGEHAPPDHVRVVCRVSHRDGHKDFPHIDMPADGKGAKGGDVMTKTHATGAAFTYGQRYLLKAIFNIAVGEDDDGNGAGGGRQQSLAVEAAVSAINACESLADLKTWKVKNADNIKALPGRDSDAVIRLFNQRVENLKGGQQ